MRCNWRGRTSSGLCQSHVLECGWLARESRPLPWTTRFPKQTIPRVYSMRQVLTKLYATLRSRLCWHWLPCSDSTSNTFSLDQVSLPNAELSAAFPRPTLDYACTTVDYHTLHVLTLHPMRRQPCSAACRRRWTLSADDPGFQPYLLDKGLAISPLANAGSNTAFMM
jgi:hypothetical protein